MKPMIPFLAYERAQQILADAETARLSRGRRLALVRSRRRPHR